MNYTKTATNKGKKAAKRITDIPEIDDIKNQLRQLESELMLKMVQLTMNSVSVIEMREKIQKLDSELNTNLREYGFIE